MNNNIEKEFSPSSWAISNSTTMYVVMTLILIFGIINLVNASLIMVSVIAIIFGGGLIYYNLSKPEEKITFWALEISAYSTNKNTITKLLLILK